MFGWGQPPEHQYTKPASTIHIRSLQFTVGITLKSKLLFLRIISLSSLVLLLFLVLHWIETRTEAANDLGNVAAGEDAYHSGTALPKTTVHLWPDPAISDLALFGSAPYSDPEGDPAGISTFRWLRNGILLESGFVPQSLLLPMDNNLLSTDGQSPAHSSGLNFVAGRFGQAVHFSVLADSKLAYSTNGNVSPKEGSLEMWVMLSQDLVKLGNGKYHPRLFSYNIDSERQLYIEIFNGRIVLASRNLSQFYTTQPEQPAWKANEWHLVTATWSAIADRQAIYYDCILQDEANFPEMNGSAQEFYLGSDEEVASIDGNIDDVRLSRRALNEEEVAEACSRPGPAPNDEVILPANQLSAGDQITYEYTPCDINGSCDLTANTNTFVAPPPLGPLEPPPQILSEDTISFTLVLTTQVLADCRWSEADNTPYTDMQHDFMQGQGTTRHSTLVSTLPDYFEHSIYIRCADLATGRDPDSYQRSTSFRVRSPWNANYPRIASMVGLSDSQPLEEAFSAVEVWVTVPWEAHPGLADRLRRENPVGKVLLSQNFTPGWSQSDPLSTEWLASLPGDPGFNCLIRDTLGGLLIQPGSDHPVYNLTVPYCRDQLLRSIRAVFAPDYPWEGEALPFDGIYWNDLHTSISWLSDQIDSDLDGASDDPAALNAAYKAGVVDFLTQIRAEFPQAVLVANTSDPTLSAWLDGRMFVGQIDALLDGSIKNLLWSDVLENLLDWAKDGNLSQASILTSSPEPAITQKYLSADQIPAAMMAEAASDYQRMRFGLITALMGESLFRFDFRSPEPHLTWWYDEYGRSLKSDAGYPDLPPPGFLGQPVSDPSPLVDQPDNNQFQDGTSGIWVRSFTNGLALINTTSNVQTVALPATYCKLNGNQAPLFQVRMDDDAAEASPGWTLQPANTNQFGETVMESAGGSSASLEYAPNLAYSGMYEVLVWIAPEANQSSSVTLTVHHASGDTTVTVDETAGQVGWFSLGSYLFHAGGSGGVKFSATGNGKVVADAVKWVSSARYNDGSQVEQVTLQPLDGIILLTKCYQPNSSDFIPLVIR